MRKNASYKLYESILMYINLLLYQGKYKELFFFYAYVSKVFSQQTKNVKFFKLGAIKFQFPNYKRFFQSELFLLFELGKFLPEIL